MRMKTMIIFLLDRSGSMLKMMPEPVNGFNRFIREQREVGGDATVSLFLFDGRLEPIYQNRPLLSVPQLTTQVYDVENGTVTALNYAMDTVIDNVGRELSDMDSAERPEKVIFVTLTDGLENASPLPYTKARLAAKVKHQAEVYGWSFLFLAANQDAIFEGGRIGIDPSNAQTFVATADGMRQGYAFASATTRGLRGK